MRLSGHGVAVELPDGWQGRIRMRGGGAILHLATFGLLDSDGDFGAAATGRMRRGDAFASLVEYVDPAAVRPREGLYAAARPPKLGLHEFSPMALQVTRPGQLGWQRFFTEADRTCVLYAVIKPGPERPNRLVRRLARVLASIRINN